MSIKLKNMMEPFIESKLNEIIENFDCCKCEKCMADIVAYSLNRLASKYVSSEEGEMFAKLELFSLQHEANVVTTIIHAVEVVSKYPRHDLDRHFDVEK